MPEFINVPVFVPDDTKAGGIWCAEGQDKPTNTYKVVPYEVISDFEVYRTEHLNSMSHTFDLYFWYKGTQKMEPLEVNDEVWFKGDDMTLSQTLWHHFSPQVLKVLEKDNAHPEVIKHAKQAILNGVSPPGKPLLGGSVGPSASFTVSAEGGVNSNASSDVSVKSTRLPGATHRTDSPCGCPVYKNYRLRDIVIHLNDDHKWTRDRVADWLDELHAKGEVDLSFQPPEEEKRGKSINLSESALANVTDTPNLDNWQDLGHTEDTVEIEHHSGPATMIKGGQFYVAGVDDSTEPKWLSVGSTDCTFSKHWFESDQDMIKYNLSEHYKLELEAEYIISKEQIKQIYGGTIT